MIETINKIPLSYTGKIACLINDIDGSITTRDLLLLQILCEVKDRALATDIALHFWYSSYLPTEYLHRIQLLGLKGIDLDNPINYCRFLTQSGSKITCELTPHMVAAWAFMTHQGPHFDQDVAAEKRREAM